MKGYWTGFSYMGWVGDRYIEFVSELRVPGIYPGLIIQQETALEIGRSFFEEWLPSNIYINGLANHHDKEVLSCLLL